MKLKDLLFLFLISILSLSFSSCDDDDESIEGSWEYRGVYGVEVSTSHPALTRAIEWDLEDYATDYSHTLIFDGQRMSKMYGRELDYSVRYNYRWDGELILYFDRYTQSVGFDIDRDLALMDESYFSDYASSSGYIYEDVIYDLMYKYPSLRGELGGVDPYSLRVNDVVVIKKYQKIY